MIQRGLQLSAHPAQAFSVRSEVVRATDYMQEAAANNTKNSKERLAQRWKGETPAARA